MRLAIGLVALFTLLGLVAPTHADAKFDACVRKLCISTKQNDCWIKAAAAMCDRDQIQCTDLPNHAPAKVIRKVGNRWEVQTSYGKGWVSDRMTMVAGDRC